MVSRQSKCDSDRPTPDSQGESNMTYELPEDYRPFVSEGFVTVGGKKVPIQILRDTGASQSLILASVVEFSE